jgi:putative heme-binding domain-containing protein
MTRVCNLSLAGAKEARLDAIRALGSLPYDDILDNLKAVEALKAQLKEQDATLVIAGVRALAERLGRRQPEAFQSQFMEPLTDLLLRRDKPSLEIRRAVVEALASSRFGTNWLLMQVAFLSDDIRADAIRILRNTPYQDLRAKAVAAYPPSAKLDMAKLPEITVLAKKRGDIERGKAILAASANNDAACMKCHTVNGVGGKIGPDLSAIGTKASRENLLESILYPSKAIADQFVQWNVITKKGISLSGLLVEETSEAIVIRDANGQDTKVAKRDIESREKSPKSLMPDDNAKTLTEEELLDLVEYLMTLKKSA